MKAALELSPNDGPASVTLSRVFQDSGQPHKAFDLAKVAFVAEVNDFTAHRLAKAAATVGDDESINLAVAEIERAAESGTDGSPDPYILLVAAEVLLHEGRKGEAADIVGRMVANGITFGGGTARRFADLKKSVQAVNRPNLFE